jgi:hypothetical protein
MAERGFRRAHPVGRIAELLKYTIDSDEGAVANCSTRVAIASSLMLRVKFDLK